MAPTSRIAARLADLSHGQLLEIASLGCEASAEVKNRADTLLAAHKPLALWAVEGVLLSSDLVPHLLAPLRLEDGAAAAVCSRWAEGWKATSEGRRRLTRVALDFPEELLHHDMAVVPGGNEELVVRSGYMVRMLGRDMSIINSFMLSAEANASGFLSIAASEEFLYATLNGGDYVARLSRDGTGDGFDPPLTHAYWSDPVKSIGIPVLAPGGLLFCLLYDVADGTQDEIVALDAQTLQLCHRFGLSILRGASGLVVVGEELFVCDTGNSRLQVFSLAGEHHRSITGEWKRPQALCFVKDRLYLAEEADIRTDEKGEFINPLQGARIFVLSLQDETLQVYTHAYEGQFFGTLCCFDGKLLASVQYYRERGRVGVVALLGV